MIFDTFMFSAELDMLECRLVELERVPNLVHVAVEADVDHQGHPKPYHLTDNLERFARWGDRLRVVQATGLPTVEENPDPWCREHAQREHVREGLTDAAPDDVILHGDVDEIPTVAFAANANPGAGFAIAIQRFHPFAVDWLHPMPWPGTVAGRFRSVTSFSKMRDVRLTAYEHSARTAAGGWHFSWVGGQTYQADKLASFCHPEVGVWSKDLIDRDAFRTHGYHVDGSRLEAVTVDQSWPRWVRDRKCPADWFRPDVERRTLDIDAGAIIGRVSA